MANRLQPTDVLVLQRPSGSGTDIPPATYHFLLSDLNQYMVATGVQIWMGDVEPDPVIGTLWSPNNPGETEWPLKAVNANGEWQEVAASYQSEIQLTAYIRTTDERLEINEGNIKDLQEAVAINKSDIADINAELSRHDARITALEGASQRGAYIIPDSYSADPGSGEMNLYKADGSPIDTDYADTASIKISVTSRPGTPDPQIETFAVNDIIRINGPATIGCSLKVLSIVSAGGLDGKSYYEYTTEVVGNYEAVLTNTELLVEFLKSFNPADYATLENLSDVEDRIEEEKLSRKFDDTLECDIAMGGSLVSLNPTQRATVSYSIPDQTHLFYGDVTFSDSNDRYLMSTNTTDHKVHFGSDNGKTDVLVDGSIKVWSDTFADYSVHIKDQNSTFLNQVVLDSSSRKARNDSNYNGIQLKGCKADGSTYTMLKTYCYSKTVTDKDDVLRYYGPTLGDNDVANKKWIVDKIDEKINDIDPAVEVVNSSTPPATRPQGSLVLTNNGGLYVYT